MTPLTKEQFDLLVPSFQCATEEVFEKVQPLYLRALDRLTRSAGGLDAYDESTHMCFHELAAHTGARDALRHLDLVLTPTGFGVVSNDNVAPASRERVNELADQLRKDESNAADELCIALLQVDAPTMPAAVRPVNYYLPTAKHCRNYGMTYRDPTQGGNSPRLGVWREEYERLEYRLSYASDVLHTHYIPRHVLRPIFKTWMKPVNNLTDQDARDRLATTVGAVREFLAALASDPYQHSATGEPYARHLVTWLLTAERIPEEIKATRQYKALTAPRYENTGGAPCYFS